MALVITKDIGYHRKMCAIYTVAWAVYNLQGFLNISVLAKLLLGFIIVFSIFKVVYVLRKYKMEKFMKGVSMLLFMFTIYGILYYLFGKTYYVESGLSGFEVPKYYYLKYIYCSLLPIYVYYDYAKKGVFTQKTLFQYAIFFVGIAVLEYLSYMVMVSVNMNVENGMTNNMAYRFVPILALLFLFKRWRLPLMLMCFIFIVLGLKRGAIIIGSISVFIHLYYMVKEQRSSFRKMLAILMVVGLFVVMLIFVIKFYESNSYFQARISATLEGDASGRDRIYADLFNYYKNESNPFVFFFGNGADATVGIIGNYAHNDWLEIAINQGLVGLIIYMMFYVCWYKNWQKMRSLSKTGVPESFGMLLFGTFFSSFFSMAYTGFGPVAAICIGYSLYIYQQSFAKRDFVGSFLTYNEGTVVYR